VKFLTGLPPCYTEKTLPEFPTLSSFLFSLVFVDIKKVVFKTEQSKRKLDSGEGYFDKNILKMKELYHLQDARKRM
jgi:hypothetical protein